jgi:hypothetical protein
VRFGDVADQVDRRVDAPVRANTDVDAIPLPLEQLLLEVREKPRRNFGLLMKYLISIRTTCSDTNKNAHQMKDRYYKWNCAKLLRMKLQMKLTETALGTVLNCSWNCVKSQHPLDCIKTN